MGRGLGGEGKGEKLLLRRTTPQLTRGTVERLFTFRQPSLAAVSESGLYKLVMRSKKWEAKDFQNWVTKVVLPAIRKDGGYIHGEEHVFSERSGWGDDRGRTGVQGHGGHEAQGRPALGRERQAGGDHPTFLQRPRLFALVQSSPCRRGFRGPAKAAIHWVPVVQQGGQISSTGATVPLWR